MGQGTLVRMRYSNYLLLALTLYAPALGGCANRVEQELAADTVSQVSNRVPLQQPLEPIAATDDPEPTPVEHEEAQVKTDFKPPFPNRVELFLPPENRPPSSDVRVSSRDDVVLMGFANVAGPRTVLKIDGIVAPLGVGESRGDVRVLAIDPPKVDLQRGERRWTENLADRP